MAEIAFNQIPADILRPGVYVEPDDTRAASGPTTLPRRMVVIGSRLSSGSVAQNVPTRITGDRDAEGFFGRDSQIHHMINVARNQSTKARFVELWAIGVDDDGSGVAATGQIALSGTATDATPLIYRVAGRRITVPVSIGDTAAAIGTAGGAVSHAGTPVTAADGTAAIGFTARNDGLIGNEITLVVDSVPAGITATVTAMASGATNPDITSTIAALGSQQYTSIVIGYNDDANMDLLEAELVRRNGALVDIPGHAFTGHRGALAAALTYGAARNSEHSTVIHLAASPSPPWELASWGAMVEAVEDDPARPVNGRGGLVRPSSGSAIEGIAPPAKADRLFVEDVDSLLKSGVTPLVSDDFDQITVSRMVTTYQQDALGNSSRVWLDITTPRTLDAIRYTLRVRFQTLFPNHKLSADDEASAANVMTRRLARNTVMALFDDTWVPRGWVEADSRAAFLESMIVEINSPDVNRLDLRISPNLMNGLHVAAMQIMFER